MERNLNCLLLYIKGSLFRRIKVVSYGYVWGFSGAVSKKFDRSYKARILLLFAAVNNSLWHFDKTFAQ